jgi:hypothetical protein
MPTVGNTVATTTTSQPGGLRVLANGSAPKRGDAALLATTRDELRALWEGVGLNGEAPTVDFGTHLVLGTNLDNFNGCDYEIVAANIDASGTLSLDEPLSNDMCELSGRRRVKVVAIPRAILGPRFTWVIAPDLAYSFTTVLPPARATATLPPPASLERGSITSPGGVVELPPSGHIALRALDDGREVWVVQRTGGDVSVVLADRETHAEQLRTSVTWKPEIGRFDHTWDSYGRSVNGDKSLTTFAFARAGASRIAIGNPAALPDGVVEARTQAPILDGDARPYAAGASISFAEIGDGHFGRIEDDLITRHEPGNPREPPLTGRSRFCKLPAGKLRFYLPCAADAPALAGSPVESSAYDSEWSGPLVVRRKGGAVDLVVLLGAGLSVGLPLYTLPPPAPRGPTRTRGTLTLGTVVTGDTHGARDGFVPACIPEAAAGGPDESWLFVAPRTATYAILLDSDHDGVLAAITNDGRVVACNDDWPGIFKRSLLHVALTAGDRIRVVVDAFGGHEQTYRLRAVAETPVPNGGVLTLGTPVSGDTTDNFDQIDDPENHCYLVAGDQAYHLAIEQRGKYTIRIETPGWAPSLSMFQDGHSGDCYVSKTPLVDTQQLEAGTYTIVVGGTEARNHGPYTLRVDPAL